MTLSTIGDQFNEMQPITNITNTLLQTVSAQNLFSRENLSRQIVQVKKRKKVGIIQSEERK